MLLSSIVKYVRDRTGDGTDATILEDISNTWKQLWLTLDAENALFELDILLPESRVITMPWFVYQIKGVKRINGQPQRLYTPRQYYNDYDYRQSEIEWRPLHRSPLMRSLAADGQLTFKTKRPNDKAFTVTVRGPGNFGVTEWEDIVFQAAEQNKTSQSVFCDVTTLSKSALTLSDVEVCDVKGTTVAIIPASETETWCQVVRVTDKAYQIVLGPSNYYTILYKAHPPAYTKATDVIPDDWGIVLQQAAVAERLGTKKDEMDMKRQNRFESKAVAMANQIIAKDNEAEITYIKLAPSATAPRYHGSL